MLGKHTAASPSPGVSLTRPGSLGVPATILTWSLPVPVHRMSERWGQ